MKPTLRRVGQNIAGVLGGALAFAGGAAIVGGPTPPLPASGSGGFYGGALLVMGVLLAAIAPTLDGSSRVAAATVVLLEIAGAVVLLTGGGHTIFAALTLVALAVGALCLLASASVPAVERTAKAIDARGARVAAYLLGGFCPLGGLTAIAATTESISGTSGLTAFLGAVLIGCGVVVAVAGYTLHHLTNSARTAIMVADAVALLSALWLSTMGAPVILAACLLGIVVLYLLGLSGRTNWAFSLSRKEGIVVPTSTHEQAVEIVAVTEGVSAAEAHSPPVVLSVENLRTHFFTNDGVVKAVDGVNFEVRQGQTLGIVGESGCGKSVTSLSIMRLVPRPGRNVSGRILFNGRNLLEQAPDEMEEVRGNDIAMIFQEPMTALNPVLRVGDQITETVIRHMGLSHADARRRVVELFDKVRIPSPATRVLDYPHQLSGGMRQRVMIAMALACNPKLLIADEPTTALDVTIQAQILALIDELRRSENMAVILITHDLGVVAETADDVTVMYAGKVVEQAPVREIFAHPSHPYTQGLLASLPSPDKLGQRLSAIKGVVPHPLNLPPGCSFAPRCPAYMADKCDVAPPKLVDVRGSDHSAACYLYHDHAEAPVPEAPPWKAAAPA